VRNRATLAGNLAHADPSNDHPATMLAYRAEVVATGPKGNRTISIDQFFTGLLATALASNEILAEVHIPMPPAHSGGAYMKLELKVGDFATAGAAVQLNLGAPPAIANAVVDALAHLGVTNIDIPITPPKVWAILKEKGVAL
jgi:carbon-monoxide dehydrogenase medium subunit